MREDEFDRGDTPVPAGYWMYESSGVLRPAVERYLNGDQLSANDIAAMRTYLRQWIQNGNFRGLEIKMLREIVDSLNTREQIKEWSDLAMTAGCDPW